MTSHGNVHRALIIRPSALGDVCRSVMLARSIKAANPNSRIDWLVRREFADAVRGHPDVDGVLEFDRKGMGSDSKNLRFAGAIGFMRELRSRQYDAVVDAQGLARSGLFAWSTRARLRSGYRDARELGWLGLTHRVNAPSNMHTVDRMLALLEPFNVPPIADLTLTPPAECRVDSRLHGSRFAVIAPTSAWPGKRWPLERFTSLVNVLLELGVEKVAIVGGPGEQDQCASLLAHHESDDRVINLVGSTTVGELMATIRDCSLLVANDSAAVHMGVGFDRPLVALYGPTNIELVGPYKRNADVIQHLIDGDRFDHKNSEVGTRMMSRISLNEVARACEDRLSRDAARSLS